MADAEFLGKMVGDQDRFCQLGLHKLATDELNRLGRWLFDLIELFSPVVAAIDEVRADGHLVVLSDGSLWEVDTLDAGIAAMWSDFDDVIVVDDRMYRVDESDSVQVERFR